MGLFTQRPEENDEWAGLPSEPLQQRSAAEQLADAAPADALGLGPILGGGTVGSIVIPITAPEPDDQS